MEHGPGLRERYRLIAYWSDLNEVSEENAEVALIGDYDNLSEATEKLREVEDKHMLSSISFAIIQIIDPNMSWEELERKRGH